MNAHLTAGEVAGMPLGTCCCCGGSDGVRHILNLNGRAPIMGRGWGCAICKLPPHGAVAVVCDVCYPDVCEGKKLLRWFLTGHPTRDGRTPIGELVPGFDHDLSAHVRVTCGKAEER